MQAIRGFSLLELLLVLVLIGIGTSLGVASVDRLAGRAQEQRVTDQLQQEWFTENAKIGVTAGASAPEILIKQVIQRLQDWGAAAPQELSGREENITFSLPKELRIPVTQA